MTRRRPGRVLLAAVTLLACASRPVSLHGGDPVVVDLINRTTETVCYLYVAPTTEESWSDDLLGSATIAPRSRHRVRIPLGNWDLRTENCHHEATGVLRGARITRATTLVLQ